jgi:hypothetical protein
LARQNLGAPPSRSTDYVDLSWVYSNLPSYSAVTSQAVDYTVVLPPTPVDHTMYLLEVAAQADLTVSVPNNVVLTTGTAATVPLFTGKTGFFGFRYSQTANAWFLLSATAQV